MLLPTITRCVRVWRQTKTSPASARRNSSNVMVLAYRPFILVYRLSCRPATALPLSASASAMFKFSRSPPPADRVAYNRALLGDDVSATFAVALEIEDLSRTGGCTRKAISEVFKPEQLKASHYNPQDALINRDPRMKAALGFWQR